MAALGDAALVGLGGALGSIGRWLVGVALASLTFPYGTLAVNVTGAFVAGGLIGLADGRGLATPARIGELVLGVALAIVDNPNLPSGKPAIVGNVAHDRSPAGYPWNTRKGLPRRRYPLTWNALPDSDLALLLQAFQECDEGTWPLVFTDQLGTSMWATWETDPFGPPGALGKQLQQVTVTFEEVPQ